MRAPARQLGFTLIELVITLVISTIVVSFVAMFISGPVRGFTDQARRARLVDAADSALERIGRDVRRALPNSVRIDERGRRRRARGPEHRRRRALSRAAARHRRADSRFRGGRRLAERARPVHASREAVQLDEPLSRRLQRRRAGRGRLRARERHHAGRNDDRDRRRRRDGRRPRDADAGVPLRLRVADAAHISRRRARDVSLRHGRRAR